MERVRIASPDDARVLGTLLEAFNVEFDTETDPADILAARFERVLADPAALAFLAGEDAGFAFVTLRPAIWFDGPVAVLDELYVAPDLRGQGIGTALLSAVRDELRRRGCAELHINVDEVDTAARRFYERHGFVNVEPGTDYRMLCYIGPT